MRLVLDTNTAVSGLIWGGVPGRLIDAAAAGKALIIGTSDVARWHLRLSGTTSVRGVAALPIGACGLRQTASHG